MPLAPAPQWHATTVLSSQSPFSYLPITNTVWIDGAAPGAPGGGGFSSAVGAAGGGGGAGNAVQNFPLTVTIGSALTITVPAPPAPPAAGVAGSNSSIVTITGALVLFPALGGGFGAGTPASSLAG